MLVDALNMIADQDAFADRIRRAVNDVAVALGGTFSAEHGIGRTLTGEMARYKPLVEVALTRLSAANGTALIASLLDRECYAAMAFEGTLHAHRPRVQHRRYSDQRHVHAALGANRHLEHDRVPAIEGSSDRHCVVP
jgi:hypothetical protein